MNSYLRFTPKLLKASAGTGKTRRLSSRYIGLLAAGESPERILATTFTRKAAGEIFGRVLKRLADAALDQREAKLLSEETAGEAVSQKRWGELLVSLIGKQHRLNVCTLDSFCVRLATSFALELGLTPGWRILEGPRAEFLRREAAAEVFGRTEARELVRLIRLLNAESVRRSVHNIVSSDLSSGLAMLRYSRDDAWNWPQEIGELAKRELESALEALAAVEIPMTKAGKPDQRWKSEKETSTAAAESSNWLWLVEKGIGGKICSGDGTYYKQPIPDAIRRVYEPLIAHARATLLNRNARQTAAAYELLKLFDQQLEQRKAAAHAYLFSDIKYRLARSALLGELEPIYYRLDCSIHHLLLDEFQDTSREEWQLVEPIAAEILAQADGERSFFCVGDTKQAIYRWRGGVAEIFDSLTERWSQLEAEAMSVTYRCSQPVIDAVNAIFSGIGRNSALVSSGSREYPAAAAAEWGERWVTHSTGKPKLKGYVALTLAPNDGDDETAAVRTLKEAARIVAGLYAKAPHKSIGILLRSNRGVARMIYELRRPELGVPASEEGGSFLTDSTLARVVLSLLKLADHPGDSVSRFHVAESPLAAAFGLTSSSDSAQVLAASRRVREAVAFDGMGAFVERCAKVLEPFADEREAARLEQLTEMAYTEALEAGPRCADFVHFVELSRVEDPSPSTVRVMTVHQAKGLEFDAVVLPDLDFRLDPSRRQATLMARRPSPLADATQVMVAPRQSVAALDAGRKLVLQGELQAQLVEALSVFYVELTRARQGLYLVAAAAKPKKPDEAKFAFSYAGITRAALGVPADAEGIVYEHGDPKWYEDEASERVPAAKPGKPVKLAARKERTRLLAQRSPSELEGGATIDLALKLDFARQGSSARGLLIHRLFEFVGWIEDGVPDAAELTKAAAESGMFSDDDIASGVKEFLEMLKGAEIKKLLSKASFGAGAELWRERRFAVRLDDVLLNGTFDRVVVEREGGVIKRAHLFDFKTDRVKDAPAVEERSAYYRPQIEAYRRALEALTRVPQDKISSALVFVSKGAVVKIQA